MLKRLLLAISTAIALAPPAAAQAPAAAQPSVSVPREVLERYVGRYELNGTIVTVALTEDGKLTAQRTGDAPVPLRTISANEFFGDEVGVRLFFEGDGPKATRIRSQYMGNEVAGTRISDTAAAAPPPSAGPPSVTLDAAQRQAVVAALGTALRDRYVFPDIGAQAATRMEAALAAGEYDSLADPGAFAARLHADVEAIAHDKHLRIAGGAPQGPPPGQAPQGPPPTSEAGVVRADKLAAGIGYIEVIGFPPPQAFKPALDRAMTALAGSRALIIDVRRNGGGAPPAVSYLVSFLLDPAQPTHINDIVTRTGGTNDFTRQSFHSEPTPVNFAGVPVYVLTSERTFSGGEEFAYDVKSLGRATLVGELTGGGANPTGPVPLPHGIRAQVPFGRAENPVTKTNWEGHGVDPDVAVPAADALRVALERLGAAPTADIAAASLERVFSPRTEPLPGTEAAVRLLVAGLTSGNPDYDAMSPQFAHFLRLQPTGMQALFGPLGELKSVTFRGPDMTGGDAYNLTFANGGLTMAVVLGPDGKILGSSIQPGAPAGG